MTAEAKSPDAAQAIRTLTRHSTSYMGGIAASLLLGFVSFPIFTRAFSVSEYGLIDLAQKGLLLGAAVSKLGLQNAALRFYEPAASYYTTFLLGVLALGTAVAILFLGAGGAFMPHNGLGGMLAALIAIRALASIALCFYRAEGRPWAYNFGLIGTKIGTIAAICFLLLIFPATVRTFIIGCVCAEALSAAVYLSGFAKRGLISPKRMDFGKLRIALAFGLPLIGYEMATLILDSGDRLLVHYMLGDVALGHYSVAYGLSSYLNELLITPLRLAIIPIYVAMWKDQGSEATSKFLETGLRGLLVVAALIVTGSALLAGDGLRLLASAKYAECGDLIPIVAAGLLVYTAHVFLSAGLLLAKRTSVMAWILVASAVVNVALNLVLIPACGLTGAAIATLLSYLFCVVLLWRYSNASLPVRIPWQSLGVCISAGVLAYFAGLSVSVPNIIVRMAIRGTLAVVTYALMVSTFDPNLRRLALNLLRKTISNPKY